MEKALTRGAVVAKGGVTAILVSRLTPFFASSEDESVASGRALLFLSLRSTPPHILDRDTFSRS